MFAQQPAVGGVSRKGISAGNAYVPQATGVTRAVIVGISDYQNPKITDLEFADRDAREFANYLKRPDGGGVDSANITLLLNEKSNLRSICKCPLRTYGRKQGGDLAIIYFS